MNELPHYETLGDLADAMMKRADGDYLKAAGYVAQAIREYKPEFVEDLAYGKEERLCREYLHLRYISGLGLPPTISQQLANLEGTLRK
jgi:hypothetical protein